MAMKSEPRVEISKVPHHVETVIQWGQRAEPPFRAYLRQMSVGWVEAVIDGEGGAVAPTEAAGIYLGNNTVLVVPATTTRPDDGEGITLRQLASILEHSQHLDAHLSLDGRPVLSVAILTDMRGVASIEMNTKATE